jgi:hypothetical protein
MTYAEKYTKSPGWASDNIPRHIFESYPRDCHPIAFLSALRSFSDWKREVGRLDTMAASGGGRRIGIRGRMLGSKKQESKEKGERKA